VKLLSVNVGEPRDAVWRGEVVRTGIFKSPVAGPVDMHGDNLDGDRQADLSVHGGPDKAVYGYPSEHYDHWQQWLGKERLPWGAFGENLTTEGMLESEVQIGDRFAIGTAELEVSQPRIPCSKLALRHERADLPKHFLASGRSGFYFRIVRPGRVAAGDEIRRVAADPRGLTVAQVQALARREDDEALLRRAADHPALAAVWREEVARRLARSGKG
jgi:MOSC domain-containing protein YiiM